MTTHLRRLKPRSRQRQSNKQAAIVPTATSKSIRIDQAETTESSRAETNRRIARLKQIGGSLQELIHLSETNRRLPRTAHGYAPASSAIRLETKKLLSQIAGLLGDSTHADSAGEVVSAKGQAARHRRRTQATTSDRRLVKLKISARMIRVLEAFRKSGHDPSRLIESSLWKSSEVRDAAAILGIVPREAA